MANPDTMEHDRQQECGDDMSDLGKRCYETVTANRPLTKEDADKIRDLIKRPCPFCNGLGELTPANVKCGPCKGTGKI